MTVKLYAIASAIIIGAWLVLVTLGVLLNWTAGWGRDTLEAVMTATGLLLAVAVIRQFRRRALAFRHCLPVAVMILASIAAIVIVEYTS